MQITFNHTYCLLGILFWVFGGLHQSVEAQTITYGQSLVLSTSEQNALNQKVADYQVINLHPLMLWSNLEYDGTDSANFNLNIGSEVIALHLTKSSLIPEGAVYAVQESDSTTTLVDMPDANVFRGYVNGDTLQRAAFIVESGLLTGYFQHQGVTWTLANLASLISTSQDASNKFVVYKAFKSDEMVCGTPVIGNPEPGGDDPTLDDRADIPHHVEMAYEVDGEFYTAAGSKSAVIDSLKVITLLMEGMYATAVPKLFFHMVHVNIWEDKNTDPYATGDISSNWNTLRSWWANPVNGKTCIQRDAVSLISGRGLTANGFVSFQGINSICGIPLNLPCTNATSYSVVSAFPNTITTFISPPRIARVISHELAHNFGQNCHANDCTIMNSSIGICGGGTPVSCPSILPEFDDNTITTLRARLKPSFKVCRDPQTLQQVWSDECLLTIPPVDLGFNLTLQAEQVILTNRAILCPGNAFTASFYNTFDPNGSLVWTLGPGLEFAANQPADNRVRNLIVSANAPQNTWIKLTFTYNCGTVNYVRNLNIGGTFGLNGTYSNAYGAHPLMPTNGVHVGSVGIQMENLAGYYNWTVAEGMNGTPVPQTHHTPYLSLSLQSQQIKVVGISVTGACGTPISRSVMFAAVMGMQAPGNNHKHFSDAVLSPNPVSDVLNIDLSRSSRWPPETLLQGELRLLDNLGKRVKALTIGEGETRFQIDMSRMSAGSYYLQIVRGESLLTQKVVKI